MKGRLLELPRCGHDARHPPTMPGELYTPSPQPCTGLGDLDYPAQHDHSAVGGLALARKTSVDVLQSASLDGRLAVSSQGTIGGFGDTPAKRENSLRKCRDRQDSNLRPLA